MGKQNKDVIARIDNQLVMKAHYNLSTNEQKLILFLVSRIDTNREDFNIQNVKIKEIEEFLMDGKGKRWGSIYERVDMMCSNIMDKKITLPKGFVVDGKAIRMHKYIQWFTGIEPYIDQDGEISLKFQFTDWLKGFLLQLQEYVRVNLVEVLPMKGKYAIRMYQVFKAERERTKKYKSVSYLKMSIEELRAILEIGHKYKAFRDFRKRVIVTMIEEINQYSKEITVRYELIKVRRRVTEIEFFISDKKKENKELREFEDYVPTELEIGNLIWSKRLAYTKLIDFGVKEGIAFKRILPTIGGSEIEGFEDLFVEYAIKHFKKWSSNQGNTEIAAATLVKWWYEKKIFDSNQEGNVWGLIVEKLVKEKQEMGQAQFDNRMVAKTMTELEFKEWYKQNKAKQMVDEMK